MSNRECKSRIAATALINRSACEVAYYSCANSILSPRFTRPRVRTVTTIVHMSNNQISKIANVELDRQTYEERGNGSSQLALRLLMQSLNVLAWKRFVYVCKTSRRQPPVRWTTYNLYDRLCTALSHSACLLSRSFYRCYCSFLFLSDYLLSFDYQFCYGLCTEVRFSSKWCTQAVT